jgi:hypothetical protein
LIVWAIGWGISKLLKSEQVRDGVRIGFWAGSSLRTESRGTFGGLVMGWFLICVAVAVVALCTDAGVVVAGLLNNYEG